MKFRATVRKNIASAAMIPTMFLMVLSLAIFMAAAYASGPPGWWGSEGATTTDAAQPYAVANQGQLKNFTVAAVKELNASLASFGGAGTTLTGLVNGWHQDYATNNYSSSSNPYAPYKPEDLQAVNVGQLKYIAGLIYGQLAKIGYVELAPTWLHQTTSTDSVAANLGQLKEVFDFDFSLTPVTNLTAVSGGSGTIVLNWTDSATDSTTQWLVEKQNLDGTWTILQTVAYPAAPSYTVTGLDNSQTYTFQVIASDSANIAVSPPVRTTSSSLPAAAVPVFLPGPGAYPVSQGITITSSTPNATIYYTTDGTPPNTGSNSILSGHSISLTGTKTVNAIAVASGFSSSSATTGAYQMFTVTLPPLGQVAAALHFNVVAKNDGTVWTWGTNHNGELGIGTTTDHYSPVQVPGLAGVTAVAGCQVQGLAIENDNTVWAWGAGNDGELGDGTTNQHNSPIQVPGLYGMSQVSAGVFFSVALKNDGTVWAWGANDTGQLGDGTTTNRFSPQQVPSLTDVIAISCGYRFTVAVKSNGTVWAWGANESGQLGDGTTTARLSPVQVLGLTSVVDIAAGQDSVLALESDGTLRAWGLNTFGQLGDGTTTQRNSPVTVIGASTIISLAEGGFHSLAVQANGTVLSWGFSEQGQVGNGQVQNIQTTPHAVPGLTGGAQVSAGYEHSLVVQSNGVLWSFGSNPNGEIGDGTTAERNSPEPAPILSGVTAGVASGRWFSLALTSSGNVLSYGYNPGGELGNGTVAQGSTPTQIFTHAQAIGAGVYHGLLVKNDGTVWAWGSNSSGQLGDGTLTQRNSPVQAAGLSNVTAVAGGLVQSYAIENGSSVWAWGANTNGEIGDGTTTLRRTAVQVHSLVNIQAIAAGYNHGLALDHGGAVWAWGSNSNGQIGNNTTANQLTPVAVAGLTGVTAICAGENSSLALSNGKVWAWGANDSGQLGDGTITDRHTPVQVSGLTNVVAIGMGDKNGFAVKSDGSVWGWGYNAQFEVGDGTSVQRLTPTPLVGIVGVASLCGGWQHSLALKQDGTLFGWGDDQYGEVGLGTNYSNPLVVGGFNLIASTVEPSVSATASSSTVSLGQSVNFTASASETGGSVTSVKYYLDSQLIGQSSSSPYGITWTPTTWGNYTFTAVATDNSGAVSAHSAPVNITVPFLGVTAAPTFSPGSNIYQGPVSVVISCATSGATIYYTRDGSTPTTSSPSISAGGTVVISGGGLTTLSAVALASGYALSPVTVGSYGIDPTASPPTFSVDSGTYTSAQNVTITSPLGGTIYYTTDGSTPTTSSLSFDSGNTLTVSQSETVKAIAEPFGFSPSDVASAVYVIQSLPPAAPPQFDPPAGTYTGIQQVTMTSPATPDPTIYYTTDGTPPIPGTSPSISSGNSIEVSSSETITAVATAPNFSNSAVNSAAYVIQSLPQSAPPQFDPPPGTYTGTQQVTMTAPATAGATIYYTTDGTPPIPGTSPSVSSGNSIQIASSETITAITTAPNFANSSTSTGAYVIQLLSPAAPPQFDPPAGTYTGIQQVTMTSPATPDPTIYYTTDGTPPIPGTSPSIPSGNSIEVSSSETITAVATAPNFSNSAVNSASYVIETMTAATPTFSVPQGTYAAAQMVTIGSTTPDAEIYYTTEGTPPVPGSTSTFSFTSGGSIQVSSTETLRAIAVANGFINSTSSCATYTIDSTATFLQAGISPQLWLRADVGVKQSGGVVTQWIDQSGNQNNVTPPQSGAEPTFVPSEINGKPAVHFNGTTQSLAGPNNAGLKPNSITMIAVYQMDSVAFFPKIVAQDYNQASEGWQRPYTSWDLSAADPPVQDAYADVSVSTAGNSPAFTGVAASINTPSELEGVYDAQAGQSTVYWNGGHPVSISVATNPPQASYPIIYGDAPQFRVGTDNNNESFNGGISEILIFNTALTTQQRAQVESYLQQRYNLTIAPPAPTITSPSTAVGTVGTFFSYQITSSGSATYSVQGTLPANLSLTGNVISGTPTTGGNTTVTLVATNNGGSGTAPLTITINQPTQQVGWWKFDENSGTAAADSSGQGNNGALQSTLPSAPGNIPTWEAGLLGNALFFSGTGEDVQVADAPTLDFGTGNLTLSGWFRGSPTSLSQPVFSKGFTDSHGYHGAYVGLDAIGHLEIKMGDAANGKVLDFSTTATFTDSKWHQSLVFFDQAGQQAYVVVNGTQQALQLNSGSVGALASSNTVVSLAGVGALNTTVSQPLYLGGDPADALYFSGTLDDLRIYNYILTSSQIVTVEDGDDNGLPDWWEVQNFGRVVGDEANTSLVNNGYTLLDDYAEGSDPNNYYSQNGQIVVPTVAVVGGNNQSGAAGTFLTSGLSVKVTDGSGVAMAHAPVIFSATGGGLNTTGSGATSNSVTVTTDGSGNAIVYFQLPSTGSSQISVTAGTGTPAVFTESVSVATAPVISLIVSGETTAPANIILTATPAPGFSLSKVDFFEGTVHLGTATASPYTLNVNAVPAGLHTYTAVATNAALLTGQSSASYTVLTQNRYTRGIGNDQVYLSSLIAVDYQQGLRIDDNDNSQFPSGSLPWFMKLETNVELPAWHITNINNTEGYTLPFKNPVAAFGDSTGKGPLYTNQSYNFGVAAGGPDGLTNTIRIEVYPKNTADGLFDSSGNQSPISIFLVSLPLTNTPQWNVFAENGYIADVHITPDGHVTDSGGILKVLHANVSNKTSVGVDLDTKIQYVVGGNPEQTWNQHVQWPLLITHTAANSNFYFQVKYEGVTGDGNNQAQAMAAGPNPPATTPGTSLQSITYNMSYTLDFTDRSPWISTYLSQPQFNGQAMPSEYAGKSIEELLKVSHPVDFAFADPNATYTALDGSPELRSHPILNKFVSDMTAANGGDPTSTAIALTNYVINNIHLTDAVSYNDSGNVQTETSIDQGGVNRGAEGTFLEGEGNPAEQCALLVYLLRQSGIPCGYVFPPHNSLQMLNARMSEILRMQLNGAVDPSGNGSVVPQLINVNYPWVAAYIGGTVSNGSYSHGHWVHIFPWLKDTSITEGENISDFLPEGYQSGLQWLQEYIFHNSNLLPSTVTTGTTSTSSNPTQIKNLATTDGVVAGSVVASSAFPAGTTVVSVDSLSQVTVSNAATSSGNNVSLTFNQTWSTVEADNPGYLYPLWLDKQLAFFGMDESDVGVTIYDRQNNFASFDDMPQPWQVDTTLFTNTNLLTSLSQVGNPQAGQIPPIFDTIECVAYSDQNNDQVQQSAEPVLDTGVMPSLNLHNRRFMVREIQTGANTHKMDMTLEALRPGTSSTGSFAAGDALINAQEKFVTLGTGDEHLRFRTTYNRHRMLPPSFFPNGAGTTPVLPDPDTTFLEVNDLEQVQDERPFLKGDAITLCVDFGRVTQAMLDAQAQEFWAQQQLDLATGQTMDDDTAIGQPLYLMGMSYYKQVSDFRAKLDGWEKENVVSFFAHGLSKMSPQRNADGTLPVNPTTGQAGEVKLVYPNVDMSFQRMAWLFNGTLHPNSGLPDETAINDELFLFGGDASAQEHIAINKFFNIKDSSSTVNLLHDALAQGKSIVTIDNQSNTPAIIGAQSYTFNGVTKTLKDWAGTSLWTSITNALTQQSASNLQGNPLPDFAQVYITPGPIVCANNAYQGLGAMILKKGGGTAALISENEVDAPANGGWGESVYDSYSSPPSFDSVPEVPMGDFSQLSFNFDQPSITVGFPSIPDPVIFNGGNIPVFQAPISIQNIFSGSGLMDTGYQASVSQGAELLQIPPPVDPPSEAAAILNVTNSGSTGPTSFVNPGQLIAEPVDAVTGAFYINSPDLVIPGPMPIKISRNYSSLNQANNEFGYGWKLGYFPYLVLSSDSSLIYAAEMDGSVVAYRQVAGSTTQWAVQASDNPGMVNQPGRGAGNLFLNTLSKNSDGTVYTLIGADGSTRIFNVDSFPLPNAQGVTGPPTVTRERPYLQKWSDPQGNYLKFTYGGDDAATKAALGIVAGSGGQTDYGFLNRIESSNGNFMQLDYDTNGRIISINSGDGRRLAYAYDDYGDLVNVTLPDASTVSYTYSHLPNPSGSQLPPYYSQHLIIRETKPEGRILTNAYDSQRRVAQQQAPVGPNNALIPNATFAYATTPGGPPNTTPNEDGTWTGATTITDADQHNTIYVYSESKVTGITDQLNQTISQTWYDSTGSETYQQSLATRTDKRGLVEAYKYDGNGNLKEIDTTGDLRGNGTSETAIQTFSEYTAQNLPGKVVQPNQNYQIYQYSSPLSPYLVTSIKNYAADGTLMSETDSAYGTQGTIGTVPFAAGVLLSVSKGIPGTSDLSTVSYSYNNNGFPQSETHATATGDPAVTYQLTYNLRNELIKKVDAANRWTGYAYDGLDHLDWEERHDQAGNLLGWNYNYYNSNGDIEWTQGSRYNPTDYTTTIYDGNGRIAQHLVWRSQAIPGGLGVESASGNAAVAATTYTHDGFGNVMQITDPVGNSTQMGYDYVGQMTSRNQFDATGKAMSQEGFSYESGGKPSSYTNPLSGVTHYYYTQTGQIKEQDNPDGSVLKWNYRNDGRICKEVYANLSECDYIYDDTHRKITRTLKDKSGGILATDSQISDSRGNISQKTDREGFITSTIYDGLNRIKSMTGPPQGNNSAQQQVTYSYDAAGIQTSSVDAMGNVTANFYDALGRPTQTQVSSPGGQLVRQKQYSYSPDHQSMTTSDGTGTNAVTTFTDLAGKPVLVKKADNTYVLSAYDANENMASTQDELNRVTSYSYDGLNRMTGETLPDGAPISFQYDNAGNLLFHNMPNGLTWSATYNSASQKQTEKLTQGSKVTRSSIYTYYSSNDNNGMVGKLDTIIDPRSITSTITYDGFGRQQNVVAADPQLGMTTSYNYDRRGLVTEIDQSYQNSALSPPTSVQRSFDGYGAIATEKVYLNGTLKDTWQESHDAAGRRNGLTELNYPSLPFSYSYQADNTLADTGFNNTSYQYSYGIDGLLTQRGTPSHLENIVSRDAVGRITEETQSVAGSIVLDEKNISWRGDSTLNGYQANRAIGTNAWNEVRSYLYDSRSHLTTESFAPGSGTTASIAYHFDGDATGGLGLRTSAIVTGGATGAVSTTYGASPQLVNQLSTLATTGSFADPQGASLSQTYDAAGQVATRPSTHSDTMTWDAAGRLVAIARRDSGGSGFNWTAVYDGLGRRLQTARQTVTGGTSSGTPLTIQSSYDPDVEFMELAVTVNGQRDWLIHGPDLSGTYGAQQGTGGLEAVVNGGSLANAGIISDLHGHTEATVTGSGTGAILSWNPVHSGGYGAEPGNAPLPLDTSHDLSTVLAWRGHYIDATGYYYLGARYYAPDSGTFLSCDPLGHEASMSLYDYCEGDPVNNFDPDGRMSAPEATNFGRDGNSGETLSIGNGLSVPIDAGATLGGQNALQGEQGSGAWTDPTSQVVGWTGVAASALQYSSVSNWTIGDNIGTGPKFGIYPSGWGGGSAGNITTFGVGDLAEGAGTKLGVLGVGIDAVGWYNGSVSGTHLGANAGMTGIGIVGGPWGAAAAGGYFVIDSIYPGPDKSGFINFLKAFGSMSSIAPAPELPHDDGGNVFIPGIPANTPIGGGEGGVINPTSPVYVPKVDIQNGF